MVATGSVGVAFALVVIAGLCTTVGSTFAFCTQLANKKLLAGALGISSGVMLYVSFVEIFRAKSIDGFVDAGYSDEEADRYATFCFFAGCLATWLLDRLVHLLGDCLGKNIQVRPLCGKLQALYCSEVLFHHSPSIIRSGVLT